MGFGNVHPVDERIATALERIATALEARNTAGMPIPVIYDATPKMGGASVAELRSDGYTCTCGARLPFGQAHQCQK